MWLVDGQRSQPSTLKEVIMSVLQVRPHYQRKPRPSDLSLRFSVIRHFYCYWVLSFKTTVSTVVL